MTKGSAQAGRSTTAAATDNEVEELLTQFRRHEERLSSLSRRMKFVIKSEGKQHRLLKLEALADIELDQISHLAWRLSNMRCVNSRGLHAKAYVLWRLTRDELALNIVDQLMQSLCADLTDSSRQTLL